MLLKLDISERMTVFAENLRRLRLEQFLSQGELARRAGLHAVTLTRLESGATAPATRTVRALAHTLGVEPRDLATPDEVHELRRVLTNVPRPDSEMSNASDTWEDDGGAVQTGTGGRLDRVSGQAGD